MSAKLLARLFVIYFLLLDALLLFTWVKYFINTSEMGGEMADTIFMLGLLLCSVYFFVITIWSVRLVQTAVDFRFENTIRFVLLFLLGICPSTIGLFVLLGI